MAQPVRPQGRIPLSRKAIAVLLPLTLLALAGCSGGGNDDEPQKEVTVDTALALEPTTAPAVGDAGTITWAAYRPVNTLNNLQSFDYPDKQAVSSMCESIIQQQPDGSLTPGIAEAEYTSPTELVLTVNDAATFWNGDPVTAEDVAAGIDRARSPESGSFWVGDLVSISDVTVTDDNTVTLSLSEPDYWLEGHLSGPAGVVMPMAFLDSAGAQVGSPGIGVECTGAYKLKSWDAGGDVILERNDNYWGENKAVSEEFVIRGVPDEAAIQAGLQTGEISGFYPPGSFAGLPQLRNNDAVTISEGPSTVVAAMIVSNLEGPMGDVNVRRALSLAMDRQSFIDKAYHGAAFLPRTFANVGNWGYAREVFEKDWESLPDPEFDIGAAKELVDAAGMSGQKVVIGMTNEVAAVATQANVARTAAEAMGLKAEFKAVSAGEFFGFFSSDPKAREGVDLIPAAAYGTYADPAPFYASLAGPTGPNNFSGFEDAELNSILKEAQGEADPTKRAELAVEAGHRFSEVLPWIPIVLPTLLQLHASSVTGAPASASYMSGHWANLVGTAD